MERMPRTLLAAIGLALISFAIPADAVGETKKPTTEQKLLNCDYNNINCTNDCSNLIDIDTAVADCEKKCERGYRTCKRRAQMFEILPQSMDSLTTDTLTISPGNPGGDDAGDDTGNDAPLDGPFY